MNYEVTNIADHKVQTYTVSVQVDGAPDVEKSYSLYPIAPERLMIRFDKYDDGEWGRPRVAIYGKRRLKGGGLGADVRDNYASTRTDWVAEIIEAVKPS